MHCCHIIFVVLIFFSETDWLTVDEKSPHGLCTLHRIKDTNMHYTRLAFKAALFFLRPFKLEKGCTEQMERLFGSTTA